MCLFFYCFQKVNPYCVTSYNLYKLCFIIFRNIFGQFVFLPLFCLKDSICRINLIEKKPKQLYNKMHPRKRYGNNFNNFTNRVTAITFNFSLRHFPCYFRFTCRSYFAVSLTDSVSETMFFSSTNCLYGTLSDTSTYTDAVKIFTTEWLSFVRLLYKP